MRRSNKKNYRVLMNNVIHSFNTEAELHSFLRNMEIRKFEKMKSDVKSGIYYRKVFDKLFGIYSEG